GGLFRSTPVELGKRRLNQRSNSSCDAERTRRALANPVGDDVEGARPLGHAGGPDRPREPVFRRGRGAERSPRPSHDAWPVVELPARQALPRDREDEMRLRLVIGVALATAIAATAAAAIAGGRSTAGKGGTMIILANAGPGSPDPQVNYTLAEWAFLIDTHDGLVAFKRVGGAPGTQI